MAPYWEYVKNDFNYPVNISKKHYTRVQMETMMHWAVKKLSVDITERETVKQENIRVDICPLFVN